MQHPAEHSPLGKTSEYVSSYTPSLLFPISRTAKWAELGLSAETLPYRGVDIWNCYELSWLTPAGKPVVAIGEFSIPADSPNIIESKSFKLYLNSSTSPPSIVARRFARYCRKTSRPLPGRPWACACAASTRLPRRASGVCRGAASTSWTSPSTATSSRARNCCAATPGGSSRQLYSHLLKSNCPVTGQPDWGTLVVDYRGPALDPASLLAYLVSFRQHQDFHEQCVERIFLDLQRLLQPQALSVYARYAYAVAAWISIPTAAWRRSHRTTDAWCASNASQHADMKKPRPCRGFSFRQVVQIPMLARLCTDGAERAGEGRVADLEALDGEVDPIDQAAFVEGVLVGQFQFDVPDQEFQFARCSSFSGGCCSSCSRRADSSRSRLSFGMVFPRRTSLRWTSGGRRKVRPCRTD